MLSKGDKLDKKALAIMPVMMVLVLAAGQVQAAHWIVGTVNDAPLELADGHTVMVYDQAAGDSDNVQGEIDNHVYMVDCEALADPCVIDDVIEVVVIDSGDGYTGGPVQVTVTGAGYDQAPNMELIPPEGCIEGLAIETGSEEYFQGSQVTVLGSFFDSECEPVIIGDGIGLQIILPNQSPFVIEQTGTDDDGLFEFMFTLPVDAQLGTWQAVAAYQGESDTADFLVTEPGDCPDSDGDSHYDEACGGDDPDDEDETVYPGAPELCDGKDNDVDGEVDGQTQQCGETDVGVCTYGTETCTDGLWGGCDAVFPGTEACGDGLDNDCDGSTDEGCTTTTSSSSSSSSSGGGTCLPNYDCTEWSVCSEGQQTRTCTRVPGCGTSSTPPSEIQSCEPLKTGSGTSGCQEDWVCGEWSACSDGEQTRTCSEQNECGTDNDKPSEARDCVIESGSEGGPPTGLFLDPTMSIGLAIIILLIIGAGAWMLKKS